MAKRRIDKETGKITILNKNPNGEGTIYQIKSGPKKGQYCAQITIRYDPKTKKQKKKSFYGKTRAEAKEKRDAYLEQHNLGLKLDDVKYLTFGEWLLQFMDIYKRINLKLSSYERYMSDVNNHIIPALGDIYLTDLDSDTIQDFYNKLSDAGKAPATIHKMHQIISQCLDKAVEKRYIPWNPDTATERPKVKQYKGKAMTEDAMNKFLNEIDKLSDKWRAAFYTLIGTGLRIGELLALTWDDVNLEEGTIFVRSTVSRTKAKGLVINDPKSESSEASIPIPEVVLDALKKHKKSQIEIALSQGKRYRVKPDNNKLMKSIYEEHPRLEEYPCNPKKCKCPEEKATMLYKDDMRKIIRCELCGREWQYPLKNLKNLVFPSTVGTIITPRNFQRKFYSILEKAGIEHINLHGLRNTFATRLIEEGEDIRVVQALLRHADIKTTAKIYAHVTPKAKKKAANKINNVLRRETYTEA